MVKKTTIYVEDKGPSSQSKMENTQKGDKGMLKGPKEAKGRGDPTRAVDLKDKSK